LLEKFRRILSRTDANQRSLLLSLGQKMVRLKSYEPVEAD